MAYWAPLPRCPVTDSETERDDAAADERSDGRNSLSSLETPIQTRGVPGPPGPGSFRVSLEAEVPEALFDGMREFIRNHPQWDQYSVITSALAGFLFQNGSRDRCVKDHYLAGLFTEL